MITFGRISILVFFLTFWCIGKVQGAFTFTKNATGTADLITLNALTLTSTSGNPNVSASTTTLTTAANAGDHLYAVNGANTLRYLGVISTVSAGVITLTANAPFSVTGANYFYFSPDAALPNIINCQPTTNVTSVITLLNGYTFQDASGNSTTITIPLSLNLGGGNSNRLGEIVLNNSSLRIIAVNLAVSGAGRGTISITNGAFVLKNGTTTPGVTLTTPFTIAWTAGNGGTLNFDGYAIPAATYDRIVVENATTSAAITVSGSLTTTSGGTLALANNVLTLSVGSTLINNGTISTTIPTTTSTSWVTDSRSGSGTGTTQSVYDGTISYAASSGAQTIISGTYTNLTVLNTSGSNAAVGVITVGGVLTTTSGGTLALANNILTLSAGSRLTNAGTISTTMPTATSASWVTDLRNGSGTGTTPSVYGGTISYAASSGAQTIVSGTYQNLTLSNTTGINTTAAAITVTEILKSTASGKIQINSGGSLTLSGTLTQSQVHVIDGDIELNGGDFIVSGNKDKDKVASDLIVNPTLPTPPYMIIRGSINDVLTSSFRQNSIKFVPSNTTGKESHIRFAGSGKTLGNISSSANMSIQTNDKAYFEIGDGTNSVTLTLQDTLRLNNGLRMRSNATLTTSGMLQLLSAANKIQGQMKAVGFIDTSVASSISGSVCFVQTMSAIGC